MKTPKLLNFSKNETPALTLQPHIIIKNKWKHIVSDDMLQVIWKLLPWIMYIAVLKK